MNISARPPSRTTPPTPTARGAIAGLCLAAAAGLCQAQAAVDWNVSGFATVGATAQGGGHDWGFVRNSAQRGASRSFSPTPDSRAGIQLDGSVGEQWEAALQGVLLPRPSGTPAQESLERAWLAWRPWTDTRLRIGRTSPDAFLFADSRHVGFALPWARPPIDFYGFFPVASIDGAEIEQRWTQADAGWRARLTAGSMRTSITDSTGARLPMRGRHLASLSLTREQDGLLLKLSYLRGRLQVDAGPEVEQLRQGLDELAALPLEGIAPVVDGLRTNLWSGGPVSYLGLGAQYETGPWTVIAEGSTVQVPRSPLSARRAAMSVGWRHGTVTFYGQASRVTPRHPAVAEPDLATPLAPLVGEELAQQAQAVAGFATTAADNYRYHQSTVGAGLRWDFSGTAALKIQADRHTVHANGGAGWRFSDARPARVHVVSVLVDMVWGQ